MPIFNFLSSFAWGLRVAVPFPFNKLPSDALYTETCEKHKRDDGKGGRGMKVVLTAGKIAGYCFGQRGETKETKSGDVHLCLTLSKRGARGRKDIADKYYDTEGEEERRCVMHPCDQSIHTLLPFSPILPGRYSPMCAHSSSRSAFLPVPCRRSKHIYRDRLLFSLGIHQT